MVAQTVPLQKPQTPEALSTEPSLRLVKSEPFNPSDYSRFMAIAATALPAIATYGAGESGVKYRKRVEAGRSVIEKDVTGYMNKLRKTGRELGRRAVTVAYGLGLVFQERLLEGAIITTSVLSDRIDLEKPPATVEKTQFTENEFGIRIEHTVQERLERPHYYAPMRDLSPPDFVAIVEKTVSGMANTRPIPGLSPARE